MSIPSFAPTAAIFLAANRRPALRGAGGAPKEPPEPTSRTEYWIFGAGILVSLIIIGLIVLLFIRQPTRQLEKTTVDAYRIVASQRAKSTRITVETVQPAGGEIVSAYVSGNCRPAEAIRNGRIISLPTEIYRVVSHDKKQHWTERRLRVSRLDVCELKSAIPAQH